MKFSVYNLGCKVNQYESDAISALLLQKGYIQAKKEEKPDIAIINSCSVTSTADAKSKKAVRKYKKDGIITVITGCVPQAYPEQIRALTQADIVIGNRNNQELPDALDEFFKTGKRVFRVQPHQKGDPFISTCIKSCEGRARAIVKIQDGCDRFCSYCIIPYSRGRMRSKPLADIRKEVASLAQAGYREVVLAGINLSSYGRDFQLDLADAVQAVCEQDGIERVRLGSLEPDHMTDEMIHKLSTCAKLCPQFHISLQSGCDSTLKRMNRHYTAQEFSLICQKLRQAFPECTLTTDVMVGFVGESDEEFAESLHFVRSIGFEKVHVFPYSPREGTKAAKMEGQIEKAVKQKRCHIMIEENEKIRQAFFRSQIGKIVRIIPETKGFGGYLTGFTDNYIPIKVKAPQKLCGTLLAVRITDVEGDYCIAVLSEEIK